MPKDKPVHDLQTGRPSTFWRIWRVELPLGFLAASLLFCWWSITQHVSVEGLVLVQLVSSWKFCLKFFGTIAAVIGWVIGTIAIITKRSLLKGTLAGLEIFLDNLIGTFTGATTGSLIIIAETDDNAAPVIFVLFCGFVGLTIGASWQMIGWVLYQGLRKSQV